ncbi:MAG: hypothetical protein AAGB26_14690 [Planctomycetota bacterium]
MNIRKNVVIPLAVLALLIAAPRLAQASETELELAAPFTDNMVLQRQAEVPVWGFAPPGSKVTVSFAGQAKTADADGRGKWVVRLDKLEASSTERGFQVTSSDGQSISLGGVLVGEVWFASGQSNMVWVASKSMCKDLAREIAGSDQDIPIREININTVSALYPQGRATSDGGWKKASEASGFSALSLSFAHELYQELGVPIGILLSAHSNTRIEAFTQGDAILAHPGLEGDADMIRDADVLIAQGKAAFAQYEKDILAWQDQAGEAAFAAARMPKRPELPGIAGMWRGPSQFYNGKIHPVIPYAIRGAIWCQGTSNGGDGAIYAARMEALVNGWRDAWDMPDMPFYFTQMQSYGKNTSPDDLGFGEIRQSQHKFFIDNRENVGMVVQFDVNAHSAGGIHYGNKLHPGMRMARWALAKQYGKDIPYTGPIFAGYEVSGNAAVVSFEKGSLFGGLMVGSKDADDEKGRKDRDIEPARAVQGVSLGGFRLCGPDKKWHAAEAKIVSDKVVVTSSTVPEPVGVQYAYNAVPEDANLYNLAGLPATPFSQIDGQFILISHEERQAELQARYAQYINWDHPILQVAEYFRDGVIIQRGRPIPVWGHANTGETVTVTLDGVTKTTKPNKHQQWSVTFDAREASTKPITLEVKTTNGFSRAVRDILVGDVWYLTGSPQLTSESAYNARDEGAELPERLPFVREFKRRTKADSYTTPRKRSFETGGGKYRSYWADADFSKERQGVTMFAYHFAKTLGREGVPQGFMTMSSGRGNNRGVSHHASPLSWTSFDGVKGLEDPAFKNRINELLLQYPGSEQSRKAVDDHLESVRAYVQEVAELGKPGADRSKLPLKAPAFPTAGQSDDVPKDAIPTYAYNWNVSPHTPMSVAGVVWVPSPANIGHNPGDYAAELEAYAASLPGTYSNQEVQLLYAQPSPALVPGITEPDIPGAKAITFDEWPKSLEALAKELARQAR